MDGHDGRQTEAGIARIHALLMRLLVILEDASRQANVKYFLAYGTAIGALRHRDFIPWDNDADVLILRDEYDEMVRTLRAILPADVVLHMPEDGSRYEYLFARLSFRGIDHADVHLDLFPLERAPASRREQRLYSVVTRLVCQMYFIKQMRAGSRSHYGLAKRLATRAGKVVLSPVPSRVLYRLFVALTSWFAARSTGEVVANSCGAYGLREFFPSSWFDSATPTPFRDVELLIPSGGHEMLESIYGDFMTPVPPDAQARQMQFIEEHFLGRLRSQGVV